METLSESVAAVLTTFIEIGGEGPHLFQSLVELLGSAKIVKRKDERGASPQLLQLIRLALQRGLELNVDQLASVAEAFARMSS